MTPNLKGYEMKKPITVRDRSGNITTRQDGVLLDGDHVHVTAAFMDGRAPSAVMAAGERILGDAWDPAPFAKLGDAEARHAIVKRKLGAAAAGKSAPAAAAPAAAPLLLTDAQKAVAAAGIEAALRHPTTGKPGRFPVADRKLMEDAKAEQRRTLFDGWKSPDQRALEAGERADAAKAGGDPRHAAMAAMGKRLADGWRQGAR